MSTLIGQQSNWNPQADEEARRRIKEQGRAEEKQDKRNPGEEDAARKRIEEQRRQEEERND